MIFLLSFNTPKTIALIDYRNAKLTFVLLRLNKHFCYRESKIMVKTFKCETGSVKNVYSILQICFIKFYSL